MEAYKENLEVFQSIFPVDVFISDNLMEPIKVIPHWHEYIEILYILKGTGYQLYDNKFFYIYQNDIVIIDSGIVHSTQCIDGEDVRILVVKFQPAILSTRLSSIFESKYIMPFLNHRKQRCYHIRDEVESLSSIASYFMGIFHEFMAKENGYEIFIKGYLYQIIAYLVRNGFLDLYESEELEQDLERLAPLLQYIEKHYAEDINLEKAANMVNLSYHYFSRYFKRVTGRNFVEYVNYVRICEAEKLLVTGNISITCAAFEVGYKNVASFNKVFKKIRGCSPKSIKGKFGKE